MWLYQPSLEPESQVYKGRIGRRNLDYSQFVVELDYRAAAVADAGLVVDNHNYYR